MVHVPVHELQVQVYQYLKNVLHAQPKYQYPVGYNKTVYHNDIVVLN